MRTRNHIAIKSLGWDLKVPDVNAASLWQDRVSEFSHTRLSGTLETILAPYNSSTRVLALEKLEVNLGYITVNDDLDLRVEEILCMILDREIADELRMQESSANRTLLDKLAYFLIHGRLHWATDEGEFSSPENFITALNRESLSDVISWIRTTVLNQNETVNTDRAVRLIEFFSDGELDLLFKKVIPPDILSGLTNVVNNLFKAARLPVPRFSRFNVFLTYVGLSNTMSTGKILEHWWKVLAAMENLDPRERRRLEQSAKKFATDSIQVRTVFQQNVSAIDSQVSAVEVLTKSREIPVGQTNEPQNKQFWKSENDQHVSEQEDFFVDNAGLVLIYPFIKSFFRSRDLIDNQNTFPNRKAHLLACCWLQFICSGEGRIREYQLPLTKVLCGYPVGDAVYRVWESEPDKAIADNFLKDVVSGWGKVKTSSANGFRGSFLLRKGKLAEEDHNWILHVDRKAWDVLLDTLPYPLSIIKLPWMTKPLYVQW